MTRVFKSIAGAFILASAVATSGCALVQEKTVGESLDDTSAGTQIKSRLLADGGFARFGEADVVVADRFALLVGRVPSEQDRVEAERIAREVNAVDEVANELIIADRSFSRAVNDPFIAAQIRARILADEAIKGVNYNIHVYDGVVYLLGFAQSEDELRRAAEQASVVSGVKRVVSYVKMRDREGRERFAPLSPAGSGAPYGAGTNVNTLDGAPTFAPATPAPTYQPAPAPAPLNTQPPGSSLGAPGGAYRDPYAPGSTPPPGAAITAQPLPPTSPDAVARYPSASSSTSAPAPAPLNTPQPSYNQPSYAAPAPAPGAAPSNGGAPISIAPRTPGSATPAPAPANGQRSGDVDLLGVPPPPSGRQFE